MINGKIEKGNVQISIHGSTPVLAAEVCCLIRAIYKGVAEEDHKSAERFKEIVFREVNGDKLFDDDFDDDEKLECGPNDDGDDDSDDSEQLKGLKKLLEGLEKLKGMLEDED